MVESQGDSCEAADWVDEVADDSPEASPSHLRRILDSAHEAFVSMDAGGFIVDWNRAAQETFGWSRAEAVGCVLAELIVPADLREAHWTGLKHFLQTGQGPVLGRRLELRAMHRDGHEFPIEMTISSLRIDGRWDFHAFLRDISERKRLEHERELLIEKLASLARTDELTGLWNRRAWDEELRRELARAARNRQPLCVALLDFDHFKSYNDNHGHQGGDRLLHDVAELWRTHVRVTDVLARYGGEEFTVAFPACQPKEAFTVVERLRAAMPAGQTCSAGLVVWDGNEGAEDLVGRADRALYAAKRAGRDRTVQA